MNKASKLFGRYKSRISITKPFSVDIHYFCNKPVHEHECIPFDLWYTEQFTNIANGRLMGMSFDDDDLDSIRPIDIIMAIKCN